MVKFQLGYFLWFILLIGTANGGIEGVIKVNYKFSGSERTLSALKAHDEKRHLRLLAGVDLPIGGTGRPDSVGKTARRQWRAMMGRRWWFGGDTAEFFVLA